MRRNKARLRARALTLIELLVVIAIMGLLATIVAFNCSEIVGGSMQKKVQADFTVLEQAIDIYRLNTKKYPVRLDDLVTAGVVKKIQQDPWGHDYAYTPPTGGRRFVIKSYGSDGQPGGEGDAQDLTNENIEAILHGAESTPRGAESIQPGR